MDASSLLLARIVGAHGIKGDVLLHVFAQEAETLLRFSFPAGKVKAVRGGGPKGAFIARIEGIDDRTAAEAIKGQEIKVTRADLPDAADDEYYITDLVNLRAISGTETVGTVIGVPDFGAGQLLDIRLHTGRSLFLPFYEPFVGKVDLAAGTIEISEYEVFL